ncbi:MAG: M28 family peptidase [Fastidiosipilaceae bacterium]|jgi:alkaline phosphatase isozyme conversion protein|nr:M28 family peptidase [Clostridiaceae bacterium]
MGLGFKTRRPLQLVCTGLVFTILLLIISGCSNEDEEVALADYGTYGRALALEIAEDYPYRGPYSEAAAEVADLIYNEFSGLGYEPQRQSFSASEEGEFEGQESENIIVKIPGRGFYQLSEEEILKPEPQTLAMLDKDEVKPIFRRQVIIGAHYDTPISSSQSEEYPDYDGISDNASGIAALLTLAKEIQGETFGYDVILVAFGAGNDDFRGARSFASEMSEDEINSTDCVYILQNIYAGDKLYAHAGRNSLEEGHLYERRRKLYETTDVVLEYNLPYENDMDLVFNQMLSTIEYPSESGIRVQYREFTTHNSDYVPFDDMDIPIVYIESGNYDTESPSEVRDTLRNGYEETDGWIAGTNIDNQEFLSEAIGLTLLQERINNTAFILKGCLEKGAYDGIALSPDQMEDEEEVTNTSVINDLTDQNETDQSEDSAGGEETTGTVEEAEEAPAE